MENPLEFVKFTHLEEKDLKIHLRGNINFKEEELNNKLN